MLKVLQHNKHMSCENKGMSLKYKELIQIKWCTLHRCDIQA